MAGWFSKSYWSAFTLWNMRSEERLPYRPLQEILSIQNRRVKAITAHAYDTVPYYRDVMDKAGLTPGDFQTADDLARLPILTGDQLASGPERFLSRRFTNGRSIRYYTSGTTGQIKYIFYDPTALFLTLAHGHRLRVVLARFVGRTFGYRQLSVVNQESTNFALMDFFRDHSWIPRRVELKRGRLSVVDTFEENIAQVNSFKPDVILGYGSYIGALFRRAWEIGSPLFRPKAVVYGGDKMVEANRGLIENEFGVPVLSSYQAVEALHIAYQCERREGFHISLDQVAARVVDENGNTLGPGSAGEIVISNLINRATVLLNYKLGDMVTLGRSSCPCGRTLPTLEMIEGRTSDLISLPGGQMTLSVPVLLGLQSVAGVVQVQLIQEELKRFLLFAVCDSNTYWEQTRQGLDVSLRSMLGDNISVAINRVDAIPPEPNGKIKWFISRCGQ